jgi:alkylation response protein AidB-like acyl-CoA dehydrogenase
MRRDADPARTGARTVAQSNCFSTDRRKKEAAVEQTEVLKTREYLVNKAREIRPVLAANADAAEKGRRVTDETFKTIVDAGMLRIFVPRRFGGFEAGHRTYLDVTSELARSGDSSSAWYSFILNMADWIMGVMHEEAKQAIWGNGPDAVICAPLTPMPGWSVTYEQDGIRISGEWPYTSGCRHADWVMVGFPILGNNNELVDLALAAIPIDRFTIKDTWFVAGMVGTGSETVVLPETFVPNNFTFRLGPPGKDYEYPNVPADEFTYRADMHAVFWTCVTAPVLGLAQAALDMTLERMTTRPKSIAYTLYQDATKSPSVQANAAEAAALIDTATLQARAFADEIDEQSRGTELFTPEERHKQYMRSAHMTKMCLTAVDLLMDVQGASGFALSNPIQRVWRDINTAARHGFNLVGIKREIYGRTLLHADEQQMTVLT